MNKVKKTLAVSVYAEEFIELIKHTKKEVHKLSFLLAYGAGLRISEVIKLEPRDVYLNDKKILVRQGKGGKDRIVPLPKGFKTKHLEMLPLNRTPRALEIAFKRAAERAGLLERKPTLHFHSLRHGFGYRCVSEGIPIHHVRTLMGHSNISTTNIYLEANPKDALKSYEELF